MNIKGKGIELRAVEPEDYAALHGILSAPPVAARLFGYTAKIAAGAFKEWFSSVPKDKSCYFTVCLSGGKVAGLCAYQDIDYRNGSVTVWIAAEPENGGVVPEALRALCQNAFDQMRMERIALYCLENDEYMPAWAEKAGFTKDTVLFSRIKKGEQRFNLILYSLLKEEFEVICKN